MIEALFIALVLWLTWKWCKWDQRRLDDRVAGIYARHFTPAELRRIGRDEDSPGS